MREHEDTRSCMTASRARAVCPVASSLTLALQNRHLAEFNSDPRLASASHASYASPRSPFAGFGHVSQTAAFDSPFEHAASRFINRATVDSEHTHSRIWHDEEHGLARHASHAHRQDRMRAASDVALRLSQRLTHCAPMHACTLESDRTHALTVERHSRGDLDFTIMCDARFAESPQTRRLPQRRSQ